MLFRLRVLLALILMPMLFLAVLIVCLLTMPAKAAFDAVVEVFKGAGEVGPDWARTFREGLRILVKGQWA